MYSYTEGNKEHRSSAYNASSRDVFLHIATRSFLSSWQLLRCGFYCHALRLFAKYIRQLRVHFSCTSFPNPYAHTRVVLNRKWSVIFFPSDIVQKTIVDWTLCLFSCTSCLPNTVKTTQRTL